MGILRYMKEEFQVIKERDPAIKSPMEVLLYPDFACARECGIRADLALGLPGKYAPKESAYILDRAVERFVRKEHEM